MIAATSVSHTEQRRSIWSRRALACSIAAISDRAVTDQRQRGTFIDDQRLRRLSPLGWDHINLTGDYVWSEAATYDADGLRPLNSEPEPIAA